ncbi:UGT80A2 [Symbiodinium sp. CCMP2592]|nr:UGT80A2 [Symbiodinium sp. CCMP2592]
MSAELLLRCKKGHAVKELKESDKRWNPFLHTVCSVCGGSIASQTARWSCEHHCSTVCDACVMQQFQMLLVELQQSSLHVAHNGGPAVVKEVEAIPWELRGTKEFNQLRKLLQQDSKPFPHAFGIVLEGAVNVPELCRRRRSTGPRASATILAPAAAAGAFCGGPGAVVGLAVGATAYGVSRGAMEAKYPDGFCDPVVLVEVLDKDGETLAAARSHMATKTRNPVWHQTLSLPCARDMQLAQQQGCSWRKHRKSVKLAAAQNVPPDQWDVASTTVRVTLYDKSVGPMDQTIGEVAIPLTQLLEDSQATYLVSDAWHEAVLGTQQPHLPCKVSLSVVQESLPKNWPVAQAKNDQGQRYPMHVFMMTRGTRGDVQPFVALARGLAERLGWLVTICTEQSHAAFVRKHSDVTSGKIRFRPSGGNTEARMDSVGAHFLLTHRAEFLQMIALSRSEAEFFSSATVFVDYVKAMEAEPKPVDLIMFGFTLAGVAALVGEHCQKPVVGFILQPSCIPSKDEDWKAVQPIHSPDGKSLLDTVDEMAFTSHNSLKLLKDLAEKNPFASLNLNHLRKLFGLGPTDTWQAYNQARVPIIIPMPAGTFQRPQDWPDNIIQTDFIFLRNQAGTGRKSLGEVGDFVEAARQEGKKLCLITFSSMPVPRRTLLRIIVKMLSEANFPVAVIYVGRIDEGPEDLENAARQFKETGRFFEARAVDFGLLFPEMDCFVVHGGLGTTVEALRTRKPCCVTGPLLMDQRFWGYVCHEKGVGPKPVFIADFEKHCVDFVNNAVNPEDPERWQANARDSDWGKVQDDGVQANVDCIQGLLSELEPLVTRSEVQDDSWMMQKSWLCCSSGRVTEPDAPEETSAEDASSRQTRRCAACVRTGSTSSAGPETLCPAARL